jgi:hypothetical protein
LGKGRRPGEQQAQIVVDLGDRADGGARVARGGLLLDGDGRRQAVDLVDVRLLHHLEELAGIGRKRLDIAALALGVDRIEGERRLAGAAEAGQHDQAVTRQLEVDVLEVVLRAPRVGMVRAQARCSSPCALSDPSGAATSRHPCMRSARQASWHLRSFCGKSAAGAGNVEAKKQIDAGRHRPTPPLVAELRRPDSPELDNIDLERQEM